MEDDVKRIVVVGTDTGIGKTVLSLLLMQYWYGKERVPFYLKPFQTGCRDPYDADSDAKFIYNHIPQLQEKDPAESVVYCFTTPKAPWFSGRDQGEKIDVRVVQRVVNRKSQLFNPLIIEAAGGLMVPLTGRLLVIDVIREMRAVPILAARAGLGTINHTLLSIEALRKKDIIPLGVVFMDNSDPGIPEDLLHENRMAVEKFSNIPVAGCISTIRDFSNPGPACLNVVENLFKT